MTKIKDSLWDVNEKKRKGDWIFVCCLSILIAIVVVITYFSTFVMLSIKIVGSSMYPTLESNDIVLANTKAVPKVGDVIVIDGESSNGYIIKRVIAVEGQTSADVGGRTITASCDRWNACKTPISSGRGFCAYRIQGK